MGKHTPVDEQRRLVDLWHQSDDSMAAFARTHGVRPGTFATWVSRHRAAEPPRGFLQVAVPTDVAVADHYAGVEAAPFVVQVREHLLRFERPPPAAWFVAVLRELAAC